MSATKIRPDLANPRHRVAMDRAVQAEKLARAQIRSFSAFVRGAWEIVEPSRPLEWAPYIDWVCEELEDVTRGEVRELVICLPPGMAKSLLVSVFWHAWMWIERPNLRVLSISSVQKLATRDSRRMRDVIRSPWYRSLVAKAAKARGVPPWTVSKDQDEKVNFENSVKGFRQSFGLDSEITGERGDGLIVDDPADVKEVIHGSPAQVAERMKAIVADYDQVLSSRLNDKRTGWRVVVAQRLDEGDLPGARIKAGARHLVLSVQGESDHPHRSPRDTRADGEPLHPAMHTPEVIAEMRRDLGWQGPAQLDQRPNRTGGNLLTRSKFGRYPWHAPGVRYDETIISVDATFGKSDTSDRVAIEVWGRRGGMFFLRHVLCERMTYPETKRAIRAIRAMFAEASALLIEAKANGQALIDDLREDLSRPDGTRGPRMRPIALVPYVPTISKAGRASVVAPLLDAGQVFVPDETDPRAPEWVASKSEAGPSFLDECDRFTGAAGGQDDQVDAMTQALLWWTTEDRQDGVEEAAEFGEFF